MKKSVRILSLVAILVMLLATVVSAGAKPSGTVNVQAASLWVEKALGEDTFIDANTDPDFTYKRAGGQLLLLRIPGQ